MKASGKSGMMVAKVGTPTNGLGTSLVESGGKRRVATGSGKPGVKKRKKRRVGRKQNGSQKRNMKECLAAKKRGTGWLPLKGCKERLLGMRGKSRGSVPLGRQGSKECK